MSLERYEKYLDVFDGGSARDVVLNIYAKISLGNIFRRVKLVIIQILSKY